MRNIETISRLRQKAIDIMAQYNRLDDPEAKDRLLDEFNEIERSLDKYEQGHGSALDHLALDTGAEVPDEDERAYGLADTPYPGAARRFALSVELEVLAALRERRVISKTEYIDLKTRLIHSGDTPLGAGRPAILDAVITADITLVKQALRENPDSVNLQTHGHGWAPLHLAATEANMEIVELLLRHGADPNVVSTRGKTALHQAASKGYAPIVQLLLDYGADTTLRYKGRTAADRAISEGHTEVARIIRDHFDSNARGN